MKAGDEQLDDEGSREHDVAPAALEVVLAVEEAAVAGEQELAPATVGQDLEVRCRIILIEL